MDTRITKHFNISLAFLPIILVIFLLIIVPDRPRIPLFYKIIGIPIGVAHLQRNHPPWPHRLQWQSWPPVAAFLLLLTLVAQTEAPNPTPSTAIGGCTADCYRFQRVIPRNDLTESPSENCFSSFSFSSSCSTLCLRDDGLVFNSIGSEFHTRGTSIGRANGEFCSFVLHILLKFYQDLNSIDEVGQLDDHFEDLNSIDEVGQLDDHFEDLNSINKVRQLKDQTESLFNVDEEHVPKVGMTFKSCTEASEFYKEYAKRAEMLPQHKELSMYVHHVIVNNDQAIH
ncbi:hypothetical protein PIB30_097198 [Stylosanthes scabra]|uniref:Transmembrane protein n=1 Tax=Stylosanthes scabra TaxID=79078 RepID=A0ABU6QX32_9FABA|nr:hypothetical protein [Stylosanthes scabra]